MIEFLRILRYAARIERHRLPNWASRCAHSLSRNLAALPERITWAFLPPLCRSCDIWLRAKDTPAYPDLCATCYAALPRHTILSLQPARAAPLRIWYAFVYADPLRKWIRALKYYRQESYARTLARLLANSEMAQQAWPGGGVLIPVPLHRMRLRMRGFNQSQLLAWHWWRIMRRREGPELVWDARSLLRTRFTQPQMSLSREMRLENLQDAFALRDPSRSWAGVRVLLVDDVSTTGATLRACAEPLQRAGAVVEALVLAHTPELRAV